MSDQASPAAEPPLSPKLVAYLNGLQRDGRLLMRYLARKADRPLPIFASGPGGALAPDVLTVDPTTLSGRLGELIACVDDLSRRAAPATVSTIRLTSAYLRVPVEDDEPPEEVRQKVRRLHWTMRLVIAIAIGATVTAVLLLAHVDDGRRAIQQLTTVRTDIATLRTELEKLPIDRAWALHGPAAEAARPVSPVLPAVESGRGPEATPVPFVPFCPPRYRAYRGKDLAERAAMNAAIEKQRSEAIWREPATSRATALCGAQDEALLREDLVFIRLAAWNCRTTMLLPATWVGGGLPDACGAPRVAWPETVEPSWWERTELRSAASMSVLSGFVLPLLLGCVGGCAYALRRLDQKLSEWTLESRDGQHSLLRVLLATMLGGLLGLVWSGDSPVQLGGFTLSLAAAAFFVGFSLEVVFTVIEAMVDGVAGKLRAPPPAPQVIVASPRNPKAWTATS